MDLSPISHPPPPLWLIVTILLTLIAPFFGSVFARRRTDLQLFSLLPLLLSLTGASFGALQVVHIMNLTGRSPHAAAAGAAETVVAPLFGAAVSSFLAAVIALKRSFADGRRQSLSFSYVLYILGPVAIGGYLAVLWRIRSEGVFSAGLARFATGALLMNLAVFISTAVFAFVPARPNESPRRGPFVATALASAIGAAIFFYVMEKLRLFAMAGA